MSAVFMGNTEGMGPVDLESVFSASAFYPVDTGSQIVYYLQFVFLREARSIKTL